MHTEKLRSGSAASVVRGALFMPHYERYNAYQRLLAEALQGRGITVRMQNFSGAFPLLRAAATLDHPREVLHLHWLDNAYAHRGPLRQAAKMLRLVLELVWLRLRGVAVYYTAHNLHGHEARWPGLERWTLAQVVRLSRATFVHSETAQQRLVQRYRLAPAVARRVRVAEHGHYQSLYKDIAPGVAADEPARAAARAHYGFTPQQTVLLAFGLVRGYKSLDESIRAFSAWAPADAVLLIAGNVRPEDAGEAARLHQAAAGDARIRLLLRPWPDADLPALFAVADACLIAHDWQLTSGSLILAMGFGKPLLLPHRRLDGERPPLEGNPVANPDWASAFAAFYRLTPAQRAAMGSENARRAAALSWDRAAATIAATYRQTADGNDH